jgi:hypothetical protein
VLTRTPSSRTIARLLTIDRDRLSRAETITVTTIESGAPLLVEAREVICAFQAQFGSFTVEKRRGGYAINDRRSQAAIARLRPLTGTDRFELRYWSAVRDRWRTFGNLGVMKLILMDAYEIVSNDPIFQIRRTS